MRGTGVLGRRSLLAGGGLLGLLVVGSLLGILPGGSL